jgi:hypothetical protein
VSNTSLKVAFALIVVLAVPAALFAQHAGSIPAGWGNAYKVAPLLPQRIIVTVPKLFIPTAFAGPRRTPLTVRKFECSEDEKTCRANGRAHRFRPGCTRSHMGAPFE